MAKVILITSEGRAKQIELESPQITVGRSGQSDIVLHGIQVSRAHALLTSNQGVFSVRDLDSSNGTFVNGLQVQRHKLRHQDVIRIGDYELRFLERDVTAFSGQALSLAKV